MKSFKFNTSCAIVLITLLLFGQGCGDDKESDMPITIPSTEDTQPTLQKDGGSTTFSFNAPQAWSVSVAETTATRSASWLKVHPTSGAAGDATITITAEPNATGETRTAEVTIRSGSQTETVTVTQDYSNFITLEQREIVAGSEEQTVTLDITSTMEYEVLIPDSVDWITDGGNTRTVTTRSHMLTIAANSSYDPRQTEVVFRGKTDATLADTVKVYQAYKGAIVVAKNEYEVDAVGGALDFKVQTNLDLEVTVSADWIKQVQGRTRGLVEKDLFFDISPNESDSVGREATITVKGKDTGISQDILVRQTAYVPVLDTVIYRTGYTWEEAHDNLPLLYYAYVERERHYTNGKVYTDKFVDNGHPVELINSLLCLAYDDDAYMFEGEYQFANGDKAVFHKGEMNGEPNDSIRTTSSIVEVIFPNNITFEEKWHSAPDGNNYPGKWDTYVTSKLYDENIYLHIPPEKNPAAPLYEKTNLSSGWYFQGFTDKADLSELYYNEQYTPLYHLFLHLRCYDQFLVIDGLRINFLAYLPQREFDWLIDDLPATEKYSAGKRYTRETRVKFLGRNFYAACTMDVYQLRLTPNKIYYLNDGFLPGGMSFSYESTTNKECSVVANKRPVVISSADWITIDGIEKMEKVNKGASLDFYKWGINCSVSENRTNKERMGFIYIQDERGEIKHTIKIDQDFSNNHY